MVQLLAGGTGDPSRPARHQASEFPSVHARHRRPARRKTWLRFGEFDFDPRTGDLFRKGEAVSLCPLPARLLTVLLARPGELVTRAELCEALWPGETKGLSSRLRACILHLRRALGETARAPRHIRTANRRGYRLTAPVTAVSGPTQPRGREADPPTHPTGAAPWARRTRAAIVIAALVAVLMAAAIVL